MTSRGSCSWKPSQTFVAYGCGPFNVVPPCPYSETPKCIVTLFATVHQFSKVPGLIIRFIRSPNWIQKDKTTAVPSITQLSMANAGTPQQPLGRLHQCRVAGCAATGLSSRTRYSDGEIPSLQLLNFDPKIGNSQSTLVGGWQTDSGLEKCYVEVWALQRDLRPMGQKMFVMFPMSSSIFDCCRKILCQMLQALGLMTQERIKIYPDWDFETSSFFADVYSL